MTKRCFAQAMFITFLLTFFLLGSSASAQQWAKTYGGPGYEPTFVWPVSTQQTADGGYIVAGVTTSFGAGKEDIWVLKLDASGDVTWQRTYGGPDWDRASSIQQTADGGYIVAGVTTSFGAGKEDFWVLKLDASGNVTWQRTYGGAGKDAAASIQQTSDGGYIVAGETMSFGADDSDIWVLKLDASGNVTWQRTYDIVLGGASSIQQTADGGYIVAGGGYFSFLVLKLDASGNVAWQKIFSNRDFDAASSIQQTADGGYIVVGITAYFIPIDSDIWVLKLDASGNVTWERTYGGGLAKGSSWAESIQQTSDGGYIVAGRTNSFGAGGTDIWVLKLDASGNITWERTYGGAAIDDAYAIKQTSDGGYVVAGKTESFGAGGSDVWVLKLDANGEIPDCAPMGSSSAIVTTTSAIVINIPATVTATSVPSPMTSATVTTTAVTPGTVCSYSSPNPQVALTSNQSSYVVGNPFVLSATITPGTQNNLVDGYVKVVIPGGGTYYLRPDLVNWSSTPVPVVANFTIVSFSGPIYTTTVPAGLPVGTYTFSAFGVTPGSDPANPANLRSNVATLMVTLN